MWPKRCSIVASNGSERPFRRQGAKSATTNPKKSFNAKDAKDAKDAKETRRNTRFVFAHGIFAIIMVGQDVGSLQYRHALCIVYFLLFFAFPLRLCGEEFLR
jgi:succinate-acetate transporter protein